MSRSRMWLTLLTTITLAGCGNPQTVSETNNTNPAETKITTPTAPAIQQAAHSGDSMSAEFTKTASGLGYKIIREGEGKKPTAADSVLAHYKGWLEDGTIFDSSYERGEPTSFPLSGVIAGWTEGLQLIGEGGEIELLIPSDLAYGPGGRPGIPPNATLNFKVELIKVQ